jgi:hypothetical protein
MTALALFSADAISVRRACMAGNLGETGVDARCMPTEGGQRLLPQATESRCVLRGTSPAPWPSRCPGCLKRRRSSMAADSPPLIHAANRTVSGPLRSTTDSRMRNSIDRRPHGAISVTQFLFFGEICEGPPGTFHIIKLTSHVFLKYSLNCQLCHRSG